MFDFVTDVCFIHKYDNGKFTKAHQIDRKFTHTIGVRSDNSLIGIQLNDALVFSLNADISQAVTNNDISTLFLYKITFVELPQTNRKYLVLFYLYPSHLNIQMIEIEINQEHIVSETVSGPYREQEVIKEKMNELRLILESKGEIVREINEVASTVLRKDKSASIQSPVKTAAPLYIQNGLIKSMSVHCDPLKGNAEQLLHEIVGINARLDDLTQHMRPNHDHYNRYKRAFKPDYKTTKFIVKNLHYEGPEFKNLLTKSGPTIFSSVVNVQSIETTQQVNITKNIINNINLNDIVRHGSDETITGLKTFNHITASTLHAKTVNDVKVTADIPKARSFRALDTEDGFQSLPHDVSVDKLQINSINSLLWNEIESSADLKTTNHINGNLYFKKPSIVRHLNVDAVNHIPVPDLMTKDSDQQIESVIWINKFFAPSISTRTVNGVNFKENVALQGQENHIKCKSFGFHAKEMFKTNIYFFSSTCRHRQDECHEWIEVDGGRCVKWPSCRWHEKGGFASILHW